MRICYFGTYEKNYPRNRNIINGLKMNGVEVIECHESLLEKIEDKTSLNLQVKIKMGIKAIKAYTKLIIKRIKLPKIDFVVVGYMGQLDMIIARIIFPGKKIIFNPMISLYDTVITDRKMSDNLIVKKFFFFLDKISCGLADKVILDTPEHAEYFQKNFNIPSEKIDYVYIGADENIFYPSANEKNINEKFNILFYGKFTPLQGIENIIKAAKILEKNFDIQFEIIGKGQTHKEITGLSKKLGLKNVNFIDWVDFKNLAQKINGADVCIGGHLGISDKSQRVVANKVFQMIAMQKPTIISNSPASTSAGFVNNKNAIFCPGNDPQKLADAIINLKNNNVFKNYIAKNGYELFKNNFSLANTGDRFKEILEENLKNKGWVSTPAYKIRKKIILNYLKGRETKIRNFLEIGVGGGDLIKDLEQISVTGEGIDISSEAINEIKKLHSNKIKIYQKNFFDMEEENKYDLIIGLELIEHLPDDLRALKKINELLKNKGLIIISVPAHKKKWSILDVWAGHYRRYEKRNLIEKLEKQNFKIKKLYNYGFPLLNILLFIRKKIMDPDSAKGSLENNTKKSGIDRGLEKKFKFFFNDFFIFPFYMLQKLFLLANLGPGYIVIAQKNEPKTAND